MTALCPNFVYLYILLSLKKIKNDNLWAKFIQKIIIQIMCVVLDTVDIVSYL